MLMISVISMSFWMAFTMMLISIIYFDRYSSDAVFLGTDKTERWTIEEFKNYAKTAFADGHGWTYKVIDRNWEGDWRHTMV